MTDETRESHRSSINQRHAPSAAKDAKDGALFGDSKVRPTGQLQSACDRVARNGGNHGLGELQTSRAHRPRPERLDAVLSLGAKRDEIGPCAKRSAFAKKDCDLGVRVGFKGDKRLVQVLGRRPVDCIANVWARQHHGRHGITCFDANGHKDLSLPNRALGKRVEQQ
jgi:hypothetical protein